MVIMALLSNKSVSNAADAFNLMKERSADSEFTSNYNCGGYALETYNWFLPFFNGSTFSAYMWQQVCEYNGWYYDEEDYNTGGDDWYQEDRYLDENTWYCGVEP